MAKKMLVAIIIARGGSKRIPRKNIKPFLGKPMIAYPIKAALKSKIFDEVMVSTEDEEIAKISKKLGAKIPFMRSMENAQDNIVSDQVLSEVLDCYKEMGVNIDTFCLIYPTAPFLTAERLRESYKLFKKSKCSALMPVVRYGHPIQRAVKIKGGKLYMPWPENYYKLSQELEPVYHDCGLFYWLKRKPFLKQRSLLLKNTYAYEMPETETQDIDNVEDWKMAEIKFKYLKNSNYFPKKTKH